LAIPCQRKGPTERKNILHLLLDLVPQIKGRPGLKTAHSLRRKPVNVKIIDMGRIDEGEGIGEIPEHDQVLKFWNGSRSVIQKGLWRDNLNSETSSWDRVVAQAEIIEILENVAEWRDREVGSFSQLAGPSCGHVGGSNRSRNRSTAETSAQSVSYKLIQY
jgi:hypothetical protein